jgi:hypothetical protein
LQAEWCDGEGIADPAATDNQPAEDEPAAAAESDGEYWTVEELEAKDIAAIRVIAKDYDIVTGKKSKEALIEEIVNG